MDTVFQDIRHATRALVKRPTFSLAVILTLALSIGANVAIFSVVRGMLLRPLPFQRPEQLVSVWPKVGMTGGAFLAFKEHSHSVEHLAGVSFEKEFSLTGSGEPARVRGASATPDLFSTLGVGAIIGRTFGPGEDSPGKDNIVILSYGLWQRQFGASRSVVGQSLILDGVSRIIVGVMPSEFRLPTRDTQLWIPATLDRSNQSVLWGSNALQMIGRLRSGQTPALAQVEARQILEHDVRTGFPWSMPATYGREATIVPLDVALVGDYRSPLLILLGAVGAVLLIACANIANLMLIRAATRQKEISIRSALGATRTRLVRQLLTESLLLAAAGGTGGLALATLGVHFARQMLPTKAPRVDDIRIDFGVLIFAAAVSIATGLLFGLLPAVRASKNDLHSSLKDGGRSSSGSHRKMSAALVVSEVALAALLTVGASLLVRSYWKLLNTDAGFSRDNVVSAMIAPTATRFRDDQSRRIFYDELLQRVKALPEVRSAAVASQLPFAAGSNGGAFEIDGRPTPVGAWPWADARPVVSPDYLDVLGVRILEGRAITADDRSDMPKVVVISRSLAERYWPGTTAVGARIEFPGNNSEWMTVVGIASDVRWYRVTDAPSMVLYQPIAQGATGSIRLVVRTNLSTGAIENSLRSVIGSIDRNTPVSDVKTMDQRVSESVATPRFTMYVLAVFAIVAIALGAIGIFGVLAHAVSQRAQEIGLRIALGAQPLHVTLAVVRQGILLMLVGEAIGAVAAYMFGGVMSSQLYGVRATDPVTFVVVMIGFAAVAVVASYLPARRAASVDPITALRAE